MHHELRVRTVCELVNNSEFYLQPEVIALFDAFGTGAITTRNALPLTSANFPRAKEHPNVDVA